LAAAACPRSIEPTSPCQGEEHSRPRNPWRVRRGSRSKSFPRMGTRESGRRNDTSLRPCPILRHVGPRKFSAYGGRSAPARPSLSPGAPSRRPRMHAATTARARARGWGLQPAGRPVAPRCSAPHPAGRGSRARAAASSIRTHGAAPVARSRRAGVARPTMRDDDARRGRRSRAAPGAARQHVKPNTLPGSLTCVCLHVQGHAGSGAGHLPAERRGAGAAGMTSGSLARTKSSGNPSSLSPVDQGGRAYTRWCRHGRRQCGAGGGRAVAAAWSCM